MDLKELQSYIQTYSIEKGFDSSTMEQRALFLMTEVGELVKELLHLSYHPDTDQKEELKKNIGLEMYDIVWNVIDLANKLDIDLVEAFQKKIAINKDRVWG